MIGNSSLINHKVKDNPECPIKDSIGDKTPLKIIDVIQDEYWREVRRLMLYAPNQLIELKYLGKFVAKNRNIRAHLRRLIRILRKLKAHPSFNSVDGRLMVQYKNKIEEFRASWQQLEELRKVLICRTLKYNKVYRDSGRAEKIKVNYHEEDYKFLKE